LLSLGLALLLFAVLACQREVGPDIVESCTAARSTPDTALPGLVQYQRQRLGSLCESSPELGVWRIGVSSGGYGGEEVVYTHVRRVETGAEVAWHRLEFGKPVDSGVTSLSRAVDLAVWRAVRYKDFGPEVDSGFVCNHCGRIWAEVRTDSAVHWFLGDFTDPSKSGLFRALEALNRAPARK
jgi:hypothetical protein